jgi:hypothetical protein
LLDAIDGADVVFCAHTGFEGADTVSALIDGVLVGGTVRVHFRRVPFADIPADRIARRAWLYDQWLAMDEWIATRRGPERYRGSTVA